MYDVVFEKAKDRGATVNRRSVDAKAAVRTVLWKDVKRIQKKRSVPKSLFWCFLVDFAKFVRTPFLQNSTVSILLIIAVSIVGKRVLTNITINYDTKTKAYVLIRARSVKLLKREVQVKEKFSEAVVCRLQIRCS